MSIDDGEVVAAATFAEGVFVIDPPVLGPGDWTEISFSLGHDTAGARIEFDEDDLLVLTVGCVEIITAMAAPPRSSSSRSRSAAPRA